MFLYILVTLPVALSLWFVYTSRDLAVVIARWMLSFRYAVEFQASFEFDPTKNYLILPNHPAGIDPLILVSELQRRKISVCPLVDESFFTIRIVRHVLTLFHAIRVPDFRHENFWPRLSVKTARKSSLRRAKALTHSVLALLTAGENVLLYPSGHITANGAESLGNRRLAYDVVKQLPEDVEVVLVRIRGLYGSMFSRAGISHSPHYFRVFLKVLFCWPVVFFKRKRRVRIYAENVTARAVDWSRSGRVAFDRTLEEWYDSDLKILGLSYEVAT